MNAVTDIAEVYDLLYRLGFSATSTAFFHLSYAVYLAALNPHWQTSTTQTRSRSSEASMASPALPGIKTPSSCAASPTAR